MFHLNARIDLDEVELFACRRRPEIRPYPRCSIRPLARSKRRRPRWRFGLPDPDSARAPTRQPSDGAAARNSRAHIDEECCREYPRVSGSRCGAHGGYSVRGRLRRCRMPLGLLCRLPPACRQLLRGVDHAHASSAAAERRFNNEWEADFLRFALELCEGRRGVPACRVRPGPLAAQQEYGRPFYRQESRGVVRWVRRT